MIIPSTLESIYNLDESVKCATRWSILAQRIYNLEFVNLMCVTYTQPIWAPLTVRKRSHYGNQCPMPLQSSLLPLPFIIYHVYNAEVSNTFNCKKQNLNRESIDAVNIACFFKLLFSVHHMFYYVPGFSHFMHFLDAFCFCVMSHSLHLIT